MGTNVPIILFFLLFTTKNHLILRYKFSKNFYILRDLLEVFGKKKCFYLSYNLWKMLAKNSTLCTISTRFKKEWLSMQMILLLFNQLTRNFGSFYFFLNIKKSDETNFYIEVMLTLNNNVQLLKDVLFSFKKKQKWINWNKYLRRNSMYRPFSIDLNKCINTVVYEAIYIFLLQTYSIRSLCYKNRQ